MKTSIFILFFLCSFFVFSQNKENSYPKYFEDQFYVGVQYNTLLFRPEQIKNNGVPFGFQIGFLKDIPINKQRNIGFAIGAGYSYETLRPSLAIRKNNGIFEFEANEEFTDYKYTLHAVEFPLEFRWRTSTPTNANFWRIYTGASFLYNFKNSAELDVNNNAVRFNNISQLQKTNIALYTSIGYGTLNLHLKYYLKPTFTDNTTTTDNQKIDFGQLKIGVLFYIL